MEENKIIKEPKQVERIGSMHFTLGEGIPHLIRDAYWYEDRKEWANRVLDCFEGITDKQKKRFLNGDAILYPVQNGTRMEYKEKVDVAFKKELKEHLEFLKKTYITIAGKRVSRKKVMKYAGDIVKRLRSTMNPVGMMIARQNPDFADGIRKLDVARKELHDEIFIEAGVPREGGTDKDAEFRIEFYQLIDKIAGQIGGGYFADMGESNE